MICHKALSSTMMRAMIRNGSIHFAGNRRLKIYGRLRCWSGQRMKPENRVFFASQQDALDQGYRPCGNCMKEDYKAWISSTK